VALSGLSLLRVALPFPQLAQLRSVPRYSCLDNNIRKLRLRCGCQFRSCALVFTPATIPCDTVFGGACSAPTINSWYKHEQLSNPYALLYVVTEVGAIRLFRGLCSTPVILYIFYLKMSSVQKHVCVLCNNKLDSKEALQEHFRSVDSVLTRSLLQVICLRFKSAVSSDL
jgi:hypothetical protein